MQLFGQLRFLLKITRSTGIARRYFITNGFDGALTMLGLLMGFRISDSVSLDIALTACLGATIALTMSGLSSAYISETAERKKELNELKKNYGDSRRSTIIKSIKEIKEKDLVQKKDVVITITDKGYIKRMPFRAYNEQKRGGKGVIGAELTSEDFVKQLISCSTHDNLLLFTERGRLFC